MFSRKLLNFPSWVPRVSVQSTRPRDCTLINSREIPYNSVKQTDSTTPLMSSNTNNQPKLTGVSTFNGAVGGARMVARTWCFTINDAAEQGQFSVVMNFPTPSLEFSKTVRYVVWQFEIAPGTARRHIQGYAEFHKTVGLKLIKTLFNCPSMHLEKRQATAEQARRYCMKEETRDTRPNSGPFEWGVWNKEQGKRNDLLMVAQDLKANGVLHVAENNPTHYIRYFKGIHQLDFMNRMRKAKSEMRSNTTLVAYGPPGTGKTYLGFELAKKLGVECFVLNPPGSKGQSIWFDGYQGEKMLIIDEMNGSWMNWQFLLRILDRYPLQVQIKGGSVWAEWTYVIMTSNASWTDWYPFYNGGMDKGALSRRIKKCLKCSGSFLSNTWTRLGHDADEDDEKKFVEMSVDELVALIQPPPPPPITTEELIELNKEMVELEISERDSQEKLSEFQKKYPPIQKEPNQTIEEFHAELDEHLRNTVEQVQQSSLPMEESDSEELASMEASEDPESEPMDEGSSQEDEDEEATTAASDEEESEEF